jgi:uncharacterized protein YdeI (YjbR/CyaY-like superfamily)
MTSGGAALIRKTDVLYVSDRDDWRSWLRENHNAKKEVWLIYYKKHAGKPSIPYEDSVEEALCFGWVDSIIKKIDDEKFARKFTPRTGKSIWSEANKKRVERMTREGRMTEAGLTRVKQAKASGKWYKTPVSARYRKELVIPAHLKDELATNKRALENFNKLAESYKRDFVGWIDSAKKEETRRRRIAEAIGLLERNQKLGMK